MTGSARRSVLAFALSLALLWLAMAASGQQAGATAQLAIASLNAAVIAALFMHLHRRERRMEAILFAGSLAMVTMLLLSCYTDWFTRESVQPAVWKRLNQGMNNP